MENRFEDAYRQLTDLKNQAENAQQCIKNFKSDAGRFLTDAALKHFRELNEMDADDIRKFGEIISGYARNLSEDLNKLNYKVKNRVSGL